MKKGKIKKYIFLSIFISFGLFFMGVVCAFFYLTQNADILVKKYQSRIIKETGFEIIIKKIGVSFFPLPAITSTQAIIKKENFSVELGWIYLRPSLLELCKGNFAPTQITLLRPRVNLKVASSDKEDLKDILLSFSSENKISGNSLAVLASAIFTEGCFIEIVQGEALIEDNFSRQLHIAGLECALTIDLKKLAGSINCVSINMRDGGVSLSSLERLTLKGQYDFANPFENTKIYAQTHFIVPGLIRRAKLQTNFTAYGTGWQAWIDANGNMEFPDIFIPWGISGSFAHNFDTSSILLKNVNLFLDMDKGNLNGKILLPNSMNDAKLIGSLDITRLSLTQWFGFARNLMPGLACALDNVTDTHINFELTEKNLNVPEISACSLDFCFSGKGEIANFKKPNVFLDLKTNFINLEKAIPESMGIFPLAPAFFHPPLTPMPGAPTLPGETGIDYDINLSSKNVQYGPLKVVNGKVQIVQGKMDVNGLEDVLLKVSGECYGGSLKGLCILGGAAELPMAISGSINNAQGNKMFKDFPELPFRGGVFNCSGEVKGTGKRLKPFLESMNANISVSAQKPAIVIEQNSFPLNSLNIKTKIRKGFFQQNSLGLDGEWQISGQDPNFNGKANINGVLWYDFASGMANFKNLPAKIEILFNEKLVGVKKGLSLNGSGSCSLMNKKFDCGNAVIVAPELKISGSISVPNYKNLAGSGKLKLDCANLTNCLNKYLDQNISLPASIQTLGFESQYSFKDKSVSLSAITGKLGSINISGKMELDGKKSFPVSSFDLFIDKLVFGQKGASKKSSTIKNWNFKSLLEKNTSGLLSVGELTIYGLNLKKCSIPITLKQGKLRLSPCKAIFYGANMHLDGELDVASVPKLSGKLEVLAFKLGQVMRDQKVNSRMTGYADFTANMTAILTPGAKVLNALDGAWTFRLKDGSWQKLGRDGKEEGDQTKIILAKAAGNLKNGIATSRDFYMQNSSMKIVGGGWINLDNKEVSGNFEVDMKGLPNFPLKVSGTLDKITTSIGTGKMILNLLGGITGGIVDIFANMGVSFMNLFR